MFEGRICPDLSLCPNEVPSTMKLKENFSQRTEKREKKKSFYLITWLFVCEELSQ